MKNIILLAAILSLGLWAPAEGQPADPAAPPTLDPTKMSVPLATATATISPAVRATPMVTPTPSAIPTATPGGLHLKDKFAIGTDSLRIDENSAGTGSGFAAASVTGLDAIWWFSDDSALDFLATVSTSQNPGVDFNGNTGAYPLQLFGGGLGFRQNLSSPEPGLKIQGLARVTYGHYTNQTNLWYYSPANLSFENGSATSESFNFIAGLGFEYFMPFCRSLSIQSYLAFVAEYTDNKGNVTYNPAMSDYGYSGYNNSNYQASYWRTGLLLNGLSLSTLAVHFYF